MVKNVKNAMQHQYLSFFSFAFLRSLVDSHGRVCIYVILAAAGKKIVHEAKT